MSDSSRKLTRLEKFYAAFKRTFIYKIAQFIVSSAAVSLLITLVIFAVEQEEDEERTDAMIGNLQDISGNLLEVQNSVSTRYLGIFPDYLTEVNSLLEKREVGDTIVVFEDVLYYGILSKPADFIKMNHMLLSHMDEGGHVTIVHYNPKGRTFSRMVCESRISPEYFAAMDIEKDSLRRKRMGFEADNEVNEKYFALTRDNDLNSFSVNVNKYLKPIAQFADASGEIGRELSQLYHQMDSVKTFWLGGKPVTEVKFSDYMNMYKDLTALLSDMYSSHGVELIPIDEYLTMTCWLVSGHAVLAFPSKYATDEIGFYSKDPAFSKYINTMLDGVRGYYR
jgi:hypothetical protein